MKVKFLILIFLFCTSVLVFFLFLINKIFYIPKMVIIPHQNAVNELRFDLLQKISKSNPFVTTVVIIGPDHFGPTKKEISYTNRDWNLSDGVIRFDKDSKITAEIKAKYLNLNRLKNDHAIFNLLAPISKNFSNAKVIPILIGEEVKPSDLTDLIEILDQNCELTCLIIYSVDFSHYLPYSAADIHDLYSITMLQNNDIDKISGIEVDSPQSLYIATNLAKRWNLNFNLFANTNSAKLENNPVAESTSHVLGYYQNKKESKAIDYKTFIYASFVGDDLKKLNARYFYGAREINLNLQNPVGINSKVEIAPIKDELPNDEGLPKDEGLFKITCVAGKYLISLPKDVLITGYQKAETTYLVVTPPINIDALDLCVKYDKSSRTFVLD